MSCCFKFDFNCKVEILYVKQNCKNLIRYKMHVCVCVQRIRQIIVRIKIFCYICELLQNKKEFLLILLYCF